VAIGSTTDKDAALRLRFEKTTPLPDIRINQDFRSVFDHGPKGPQYQRYIVLHDTEGSGSPQSVINWWAGNGNRVAAHFVIGRDGSIWQCVPLDRIAHHAGYAPNGSNARFNITEDGRDDMLGTRWISSSYSDYGMNAYSIGIEMVHVGGSGFYPEAQLVALDSLIAYLDAFYGFESTIIDHKAWAIGNSDTSPEFAPYLRNYQSIRRHA
jgi:N-acetyl-anhydromuramyl-L-alanine amidase AmpD